MGEDLTLTLFVLHICTYIGAAKSKSRGGVKRYGEKNKNRLKCNKKH